MQNPASGYRNHAPETAAKHLVRQVPTGSPEETVASILARLPGNIFDYADTIYVLDRINTLVGMVPMARLLAAAPHHRLSAIAREPHPVVHPEGGSGNSRIARPCQRRFRSTRG